MEGKSSADPLQQLKWVQEQLLRIQAVCAKTLNKAPHLKEIIYDFSELADTLLIVTGKAIQLHQLVDAYYSEDSIEFETKTIVNLLLEVARTRDNILVQVKELIEYYNDLAEWTEQISGMENKKLPYDTYRYMQTLKRYIETEQTTTEQQLIGLQYYSQSEVQSVIQISVHSKHSAKQKYLEIQQVVGRVVKCYIALAGHTQLSVTPIVESAYEVVELISCPTCRFVLTTLQLLAPSLAFEVSNHFINKRSHIFFLGCSTKMDELILEKSIIYDALFAELRKIETLKSFWEQSVINVHRYEANKAVQNKMLEKLVKIDLLDIWKFLRLLVTNFPTQIDLKEVEWKSWCNEKVNSSGLVLSVQSTEKGYGKVRIQKPGVVLNEVNEIENIRFDSIWRLVACFANHLIRVNLITRTGKKD